MHDNHRSCIVVSVCWIKISGGISCYTIYGLCMVMSIELLWISVFRMLMSSQRLRIYSSRWPRRALRCQW
ncbi:hypothetical protein ERO13_D03G175550v2 [Gossypium hirsutum]|uniref:Uncharacterized protein n=3 Tax=Gossypium TaxID=3633 RepID=A0A5D2VPR6_GOSMU|nr:hypothetical protein ERO13_D03G175550v2 [Gossypium hirsutum]TYG77708.1 hypothetical protein ES288_D03G216100v1 [Gossypium darwinii]TYH81600.1 hypothetical protein ES332_D03G212400v1 [Gossypium tomentosum]TYI91483.1 hypothetical protein E1A91_D03G195800v1 [Gossypium mustelinum]